MEIIELKGVRLCADGLAPETQAYVAGKQRRQRRRKKERRNPINRLIDLVLPADYRRVEVETRVSGRILVVGCNGGIETLGLGAVGIDVDFPALRIAMDLKAHAEGATAEFLAASGGDLPFREASFDNVLSDNVIEHLPGEILPRHFQEAARVLRRGGQYVMTTPNRLFENPVKGDHISLHSYAEWETMVSAAGFRELRTPRRRSGELGDLEWKKAEERRASETGTRIGLSHKGIRLVTLVATR